MGDNFKKENYDEDYTSERLGWGMAAALGFGLAAMVGSVCYVGYKFIKGDFNETINKVLRPNFVPSLYYGNVEDIQTPQEPDVITYAEALTDYNKTNEANRLTL